MDTVETKRALGGVHVHPTKVFRRRQSTGTRGAMGSFRGAHGERVEREPITGVWGQSPQRGPGAEPLVRGPGWRSPSEAESFLALGRATDRANL